MYLLRWLLFRRFRMAAELCHQAAKLLNHQKDLLTSEAFNEMKEAIGDLRNEMRSSGNRVRLEEGITRLEQAGSRRLVPYRNPGIRENVEVMLFAVAIAMSIRTFFFQPMGIPTGSMQPTLYGITESNLKSEEHVPKGVNAWVKYLLAGVSYCHVLSEGNWQLIRIEPPTKKFLFFNRQKLIFRDLDSNNEVVREITPLMNSGKSLLAYGRASQRGLSEYVLNSHNNYIYKPGEEVVKMRRESGDHLLVSRFYYNFIKPNRGDIIVFETRGIKGIADQDLFYIKRLVGMPEDTLAIGNDRHLIVKNRAWPAGRRIDSSDHPFEFVYSFDVFKEPNLAKDSEYSGHANQKVFNQYMQEEKIRIAKENGIKPDAIYINNSGTISPLYMDEGQEFYIPPNQYAAFGDNTVSSKDSREWGSLPAKNIFGKASFIYWPFFGQNGRIRPNRFGWAFQ